MKSILYILIFTLLCGFYSCNSNPAKPIENTNSAPEKLSFDSFKQFFAPVALPLYLPLAEANPKAKEIDSKWITAFFEGKELIPAFGQNHDVPELSKNSGESKYIAQGILTGTNNYNAIIILNKTNGDYYLCTFSKTGEYLSGICLAFTEEDPSGKTERTASLNEDFSIQIRQTDSAKDKKSTPSQSAFFVISEEGIISAIVKNAKA